VDGLGSIVLGESLYFSAISLGAFFRSESHGTVAGRRKLSVRHVVPSNT
jgi:hypothetical protein